MSSSQESPTITSTEKMQKEQKNIDLCEQYIFFGSAQSKLAYR